VVSRILVIDDNNVDREHVRRLLGAEQVIVEAGSVHAALAILNGAQIDCALLDQRLPDGEGIGLLATLVARRVPVVMLTALGNERLAVQAIKGGAYDYIAKHQLTPEGLQRSVAHAIELSELQGQLAASNRVLEEREAQMRVMLAQLPAIVWTTSSALCYTSVNGAALSVVGGIADDLVGTELRGGVPGASADPAAVQAHCRALTGESARYTAQVGGRVYECLIEALRTKDGLICGTIGVALDTSEARRLESELRHSHKMEAVGQLAGGVAHDFNNLLTAILGFAGFARSALDTSSAAAADLDQALLAANRARELVSQLLAFSRRQPVQPRVFPINRVIEEMSAMLRRLIGADIELCLSLSAEYWNVRMDASGLEQVIANLAINARDAMPSGGRVTLSTENLTAHDELVLDAGQRLPPGEHVVIFVSDTGTGIPAAILERIFEPFFTTKELGRGTGLGLSTCHGVVSQAGGIISVRSELGTGTTFCIYLPREIAARDRTSLPVADSVRGGRETVLVVEDDDQVRAVVTRILLGFGYQVLEASSGRRAIEIVRGAAMEIDLVLTDVVMPDLGVVDVVETLRNERPRTRVLFMSGYNRGMFHQHPLLKSGAKLLQKPITPDTLARKVRQVLDGPRPAACPTKQSA
jgi:two-component system cell cycle sensor histidine kinase/response regulator CckA